MKKINVIETGIEGLIVIEPTVFGDERGYFMETWNRNEYEIAGLKMAFVQDNESKSHKGVLRGMHFQVKNPQGKLVRVISGQVFDVAVDLRKNSPTCGKWYGVMLSEENKRQLYVPEGFAHGFLVVSETAVFSYKCTRFYDPTDELGIIWNDSDIGIKWPDIGQQPVLSAKDQALRTSAELGFWYK